MTEVGSTSCFCCERAHIKPIKRQTILYKTLNKFANIGKKKEQNTIAKIVTGTLK